MAKVPLPESKFRARRRKRTVVLSCVFGAFFLAVLGGLIYLSWRPFVRIQEVRVEGAQTIATSTLEKFVQARLAGAYLGIIPRDNIFIYPKGRIEGNLRAAYPVFAGVAVHADDFSSLSLVVSERQPRELWCGASADAPQACLYLDGDGVAYAQAPAFSGAPYVRYYGALSAGDLPRQFLSPSVAHSLFALIEAMGQKGGSAEEVSVEENGDVSAIFGGGFTVRFSLGEDSAKIFQRFTLALESAPFTSHKLSDFQYLDLRFGEKLYYKLRQ